MHFLRISYHSSFVFLLFLQTPPFPFFFICTRHLIASFSFFFFLKTYARVSLRHLCFSGEKKKNDCVSMCAGKSFFFLVFALLWNTRVFFFLVLFLLVS